MVQLNLISIRVICSWMGRGQTTACWRAIDRHASGSRSSQRRERSGPHWPGGQRSLLRLALPAFWILPDDVVVPMCMLSSYDYKSDRSTPQADCRGARPTPAAWVIPTPDSVIPSHVSTRVIGRSGGAVEKDRNCVLAFRSERNLARVGVMFTDS